MSLDNVDKAKKHLLNIQDYKNIKVYIIFKCYYTCSRSYEMLS